jgi:hypothetical protein
MAEFSTARAFTQVQTHAKTSLCGLWNHDQVAIYLQNELQN